MSQADWDRVDAYLEDALLAPDPALKTALAESAAAGLPDIQVAANQGALLKLLAEMAGARRILEVGTLGGYSTIWLGRALPEDGTLITLEYEPHHAEVARRNIACAGLAAQTEVRVGPAIDLLLALEGGELFDFVFIDADKPNNPDYVRWALKLTRPGGLIVVDNVVRGGRVTQADGDAAVRGVRAMFELIAAEPRLSATAIQTVGSKGWDGLCVMRVTS